MTIRFNWCKTSGLETAISLREASYDRSTIIERTHDDGLIKSTILRRRRSLLIKSTISSQTESSWNNIYLLTTCTSVYMLHDKSYSLPCLSRISISWTHSTEYKVCTVWPKGKYIVNELSLVLNPGKGPKLYIRLWSHRTLTWEVVTN